MSVRNSDTVWPPQGGPKDTRRVRGGQTSIQEYRTQRRGPGPKRLSPSVFGPHRQGSTTVASTRRRTTRFTPSSSRPRSERHPYCGHHRQVLHVTIMSGLTASTDLVGAGTTPTCHLPQSTTSQTLPFSWETSRKRFWSPSTTILQSAREPDSATIQLKFQQLRTSEPVSATIQLPFS